MNKEVESYIFELLEGISEALEFQKRTGNTRLAGDIIESRKCIERSLYAVVPYPIMDRIDSENMQNEDWLLAMYRIMGELKQPFCVQNRYDREFLDLLHYLWDNKKEKLVENMKNRLGQIREIDSHAYDGFLAYFKRFPLWGTIDPKEEDYQTLELRADVLKQKSYEFLWLYQRLEDYLSKYTLYAILKNWAILDFYDIAKVNSIFPDYYEPDIFADNKEDVFVDVGAYNGDSILQYIQMYGTEYKKIYAYEISKDSCAELEKNLSNYHDIVIRQKGAGASGGVFMYLNETEDTTANHLEKQQTNGEAVEVVSLDEDIKEPVTFVKMDIEGAEQDAILGMRKIIERDHPKLAICTYHGYEDIWKIPFIIDSICPQYKFYLRHYGGNLIPTEFVLLCKYDVCKYDVKK